MNEGTISPRATPTSAALTIEPIEIATIEIRWLVSFMTLAILTLNHQLSIPAVLGFIVLGLYNIIRTATPLFGKPFVGGRASIIIIDTIFITYLLLVIDHQKLIYLYALYLLPVALTVVWARLMSGLAISAAILVLTAVLFLSRTTIGPESISFILFAGVMLFSLSYLSAKGSAGEVAKRIDIEGLVKEITQDRAKLRALIDGIPDGLIAVDRHGYITFFNLAATSLVGKHNINLIGLPIAQVMNTTAGINSVNITEKVLTFGGKEQRDDLRIFAQGRSVRLSTSVAPILDEKGDIDGAIAVFRDISSEKVDEEDHRALTSVISHQLRTPVTAIEGYLSYLLGSRSLSYDEQTKQYLQKAHESAINLTALITDILAISKAESGRLQVDLSSVRIDELVNTVVHRLTPKAIEKRLNIVVEPIPPLEPIITDGGKIMEALDNLLDNAIKYSAQGTITVKVAFDASNISIAVSDQGVGLNDEEQDSIFHKFHRLENWQTRTEAEGGGMGLYISRTLMQMIGGTITVRSDLGKGSTFTIIIPTTMSDPDLARKVAQMEAHHSAKAL